MRQILSSAGCPTVGPIAGRMPGTSCRPAVGLKGETTSGSWSDGLEEAVAIFAAGDDVGDLRGAALDVHVMEPLARGGSLMGARAARIFSGPVEPARVIASRNIPIAP